MADRPAPPVARRNATKPANRANRRHASRISKRSGRQAWRQIRGGPGRCQRRGSAPMTPSSGNGPARRTDNSPELGLILDDSLIRATRRCGLAARVLAVAGGRLRSSGARRAAHGADAGPTRWWRPVDGDADHRRRSRCRGAGHSASSSPQIPPEQQRAALIDDPDRPPPARQGGGNGGPRQERRWSRRSLAFVRDQALRSEYLRDEGRRRASPTTRSRSATTRRSPSSCPSDEVHVRHILVKTEDEAKAIIADLDKGGDFADDRQGEVAATPARPPRAAISASSARARRCKPFEDAAFALDVGKYTKTPVKTAVRLARHQGRGEAQGSRRRPSSSASRPIRQQLRPRDRRRRDRQTLRAAAKIEIVPDASRRRRRSGRARRPPAPAPGRTAADAAPADSPRNARAQIRAGDDDCRLAARAGRPFRPAADRRRPLRDRRGRASSTRTGPTSCSPSSTRAPTVAGVFTRSKCPSAPVDWCKAALAERQGAGAARQFRQCQRLHRQARPRDGEAVRGDGGRGGRLPAEGGLPRLDRRDRRAARPAEVRRRRRRDGRERAAAGAVARRGARRS